VKIWGIEKCFLQSFDIINFIQINIQLSNILKDTKLLRIAFCIQVNSYTI